MLRMFNEWGLKDRYMLNKMLEKQFEKAQLPTSSLK